MSTFKCILGSIRKTKLKRGQLSYAFKLFHVALNLSL